MAEYDETIELGVLEEEALQSIEMLLEELGREPLPEEVKFYNSYNKREPKRDETYSRFNFPINDQLEGIAVLGTMYVRTGSKRQENPHRIVRNCFKLLTALGAKPQGQLLALHHSPANENFDEEDVDELLSKLAYYSNLIGVPTLDINIRESELFSDYSLLNMVIVGTKPAVPKPNFDLSYSKLVLITPAFEASDEAKDIILSKLYSNVRKTQSPLVFLISGRKGIAGQLLKHLKPQGLGVRFFVEGFDGFVHSIDELLIRQFKTEIVFLTQHPGDIVKIASDCNVEARIIGEITKEPILKVDKNGSTLCALPMAILKDEIEYPEAEMPEFDEAEELFELDNIKPPTDLRDVAFNVLKACISGRKKYALSFFDNTIKANNLSLHFPSDAAVLKLHGYSEALAIRLNSTFNAFRENQVERSSVNLAETARQIACCGGEPNYLFSNFNIKNSNSRHCTEIANSHMVALQKAAEQLSHSHAHYEFNFDLKKNNDSASTRSVTITGGIGLIEDTDRHMSIPFKNKGDLIFLLGESQNCIGSSVYLREVHGLKDSSTRFIHWENERKVQKAVLALIRERIICSARSIGKGGLFVALVESCLKNKLGFDITSVADVRDDAFLFSEANGRVLVSLTMHKRGRFIDFLEKRDVPFTILGHVTKGEMRIEDKSYGFVNEIAKWF